MVATLWFAFGVAGRGARTRWFVVAPLAHGEFLTCVLRAAGPRDLNEEGVFVVPPGTKGERLEFDPSMRLCVSARVSAPNEVLTVPSGATKEDEDD